MRLQAILALLCALAAAAAYHFTPHLMLADLQPVKLESMIPQTFGHWRTIPVSSNIISQPEQEATIKRIYSQVLSRTYIDDMGNQIMLAVAYTRNQSDNAGSQSHKPEVCYPAQGFVIKSNEVGKLTTEWGAINIKELLAVQDHRVEPIIYWTMVGNQVAINSWQLKSAQLKYGFNNIIPDGLIFRVSTITSSDSQRYDLQKKFTNEMLKVLNESNRTRLAGL